MRMCEKIHRIIYALGILDFAAEIHTSHAHFGKKSHIPAEISNFFSVSPTMVYFTPST